MKSVADQYLHYSSDGAQLTTTNDIENGSLVYTNYAGYYESQAYTNALAVYDLIKANIPNLPGSPILTIDSLFNEFELMSNPAAIALDDLVT